MKMYFEYFKSVVSHKKSVFKKCWRRGLKKEAIMHDMSKFLPSEFIPYAKWFNGPHGVKIKDKLDSMSEEIRIDFEFNQRKFLDAVDKHYKRNKHHWNHWAEGDLFYESIPQNYLVELLCDWESVGELYGNTTQEYYLRNYFQIKMSNENRWRLEMLMGFRKPNDVDWDPLFNMTLMELLEFNLTKGTDTSEETALNMLNHKFREVNDRYKIKTADLLLESYKRNKQIQ